MKILQKDRSILRRLADQQAAIASLPVHAEKILEWKRHNGNILGRPLVWINEIPWHEMDVDGELELHTTDPFCRKLRMPSGRHSISGSICLLIWLWTRNSTRRLLFTIRALA